ncbi:shikimate kinase [Geminisphaera colitermitum]|uniref:shikimate kinase n=1 Tax=Geminisphaera colitermitum TaxID=1148786 RepID=UPI000158C511|nr:shikimate kinase [Geminisphaera colitermitum]
MNTPGVNLYLVGFMGTGKTTVSRIVAQRLGYHWVDSDQFIERAQRRTIPDIFATEGEAAFRVMEREFVENGHAPTREVVACGGGLIVPPGMLDLLKSKGVVICLHASLETILQRTQGQGTATRPLLNVDNPEQRIRALYAAREPIYRRAGTMILTDNRQMPDIVQHVLRAYQRDAADFLRERERNLEGRPAAPHGVHP